MSRQEILIGLKEILVSIDNDKYKNVKLTEDKHLSTDLSLASIDMLYLIVVIEHKFGIEINNAKLSDYKTVKDVIDTIVQKV